MIAHGSSTPYIVGEWSGGGVGQTKSLRFANDYPHYHVNILDFQLSLALNRFIGGAFEVSSERLDAQGLDAMLHERVTAFEGRDDWQGTFIDNHDDIRTLVRLKKLGDTSAGDRGRRMDLATVLLLTVRGIPIIMYGDEQYLAHDDPYDVPLEDVNTGNDDPYNRVGMKTWDENAVNFRIVSILATMRREKAALASGAYATLYAKGDVVIYRRGTDTGAVYVGVNRGKAARITLSNAGLSPGVHRNLLAPGGRSNSLDLVKVARARATFELAPLSAIVVAGE